MNDTFWQVLWMAILGGGLVGMAGLLLAVGTGSVRELRQSLDELKSGGEDGESVRPPSETAVPELSPDE